MAPPAAALLGAVIAPTDPVQGKDVEVGAPLEGSDEEETEEHDPTDAGEEDEVRFALTSEAGVFLTPGADEIELDQRFLAVYASNAAAAIDRTESAQEARRSHQTTAALLSLAGSLASATTTARRSRSAWSGWRPSPTMPARPSTSAAARK